MARLSIDYTFFTDRRFDHLAKLLTTSRAEVESSMLRLWHYCYITIDDTLKVASVDLQGGFTNLSEMLVRCDLAEDLGDGMIRIKGINKRIDYLKRASEHGKKSAEVRKRKYGSSAPKQPSSPIEGSTKVPSASHEPIPIPIPTPTPTPKKKKTAAVTSLETRIKQKRVVWLQEYSDAAWIDREIAKANEWASETGFNPKNTGFYSNWLERSFAKKSPELEYRKIADDIFKPHPTNPNLV
jgi:hypothetical protein